MLTKHVNATGHVMNGLEKEPGAAVLFAVNKEFGKPVDWLLTGKAFVEPKKVRQSDGNLLWSTLETSNERGRHDRENDWVDAGFFLALD